jgi:hypothetical protein
LSVSSISSSQDSCPCTAGSLLLLSLLLLGASAVATAAAARGVAPAAVAAGELPLLDLTNVRVCRCCLLALLLLPGVLQIRLLLLVSCS